MCSENQTCKVIAVSNQKGGVGKTTTTINLGASLVRLGQRVLLVDADSQGHLTLGLGFSRKRWITLKTMLENIIMGTSFKTEEGILKHQEGMDVIPSNKLLAGMDMALNTVENRELVLKEYLESIRDQYDFILIDCMPSLGMLTINAMTAADSVLVPVEPAFFSADGLTELLKVLSKIEGLCLRTHACSLVVTLSALIAPRAILFYFLKHSYFGDIFYLVKLFLYAWMN